MESEDRCGGLTQPEPLIKGAAPKSMTTEKSRVKEPADGFGRGTCMISQGRVGLVRGSRRQRGMAKRASSDGLPQSQPEGESIEEAS